MQLHLFHGSSQIVAQPMLERCRPGNDYGRAFYCTESRDLAREWACPDARNNGVLNEYVLESDDLQVLDLDEYPVLYWIAVLLTNRSLDCEWTVRQDAQRLLETYAIDVSEYDIVEGYRADDSYYSIARAFISGAINDVTLERALRLGKLGRQVALRTEKALGALRFLGAEPVDARVWGARRLVRDRKARNAFTELRQEAGAFLRPSENVQRHDGNGLWIYDIGGDGSSVAH